MRTLFPWFGGKTGAVNHIWDALDGLDCYIEPFAGAAAAFFGRPNPGGVEILGDADGHIVNFYRAMRGSPEMVWEYSRWPSTEADLMARHRWLIDGRESLIIRLESDPFWYDADAAGWWWWGVSSWFGSGWGWRASRQRPHIDRSLKGSHRTSLEETFAAGSRLDQTVLLCGDFERTLSESVLRRFDRVGVFLDPPYQVSTGRQAGLYAEDGELDNAAERAEAWALSHPRHRVVYAGYAAQTLDEAGWRRIVWRAPNGMASEHNQNRKKDVLWLSPACQSARLEFPL